MEDRETGYTSPKLEDLGTLTELTLANELFGMEDAGMKLSILDVSSPG